MAEALAPCINSDGEKDHISPLPGGIVSTEVQETYRSLCDHYSRGCSFVVSL